MREWTKYFFGSFFNGSLAIEGSTRSIVNAIGGCILAGIFMLVGLYAGHTASFPHLWEGAQPYRDAIYSTLSSDELSFEIKAGAAASSAAPYISPSGSKPLIIADFRDTEGTYVAFSVGYATQDGQTVSTEEYQALPESEQGNYTFYFNCSDESIDPADPENIALYREYLSSLPDTSELSKLDPAAEDYADKLYALYVTSRYPQLSAPPVLLNYYNQLLDELGQQEFLILLQQHCFASFLSGDDQVSVNGYYTQDVTSRELAASSGRIDSFFSELFSSSAQFTLFLYIYNIPRSTPTILVLWLLLSVCSLFICRSKELEFGSTFLSSAKVLGSFLPISGAFAGIYGFIGSFFAGQSEIYSMTLQTFYLIFILRCIAFLIRQLTLLKEPDSTDE